MTENLLKAKTKVSPSTDTSIDESINLDPMNNAQFVLSKVCLLLAILV
jgi:hypothetical protein